MGYRWIDPASGSERVSDDSPGPGWLAIVTLVMPDGQEIDSTLASVSQYLNSIDIGAVVCVFSRPNRLIDIEFEDRPGYDAFVTGAVGQVILNCPYFKIDVVEDDVDGLLAEITMDENATSLDPQEDIFDNLARDTKLIRPGGGGGGKPTPSPIIPWDPDVPFPGDPAKPAPMPNTPSEIPPSPDLPGEDEPVDIEKEAKEQADKDANPMPVTPDPDGDLTMPGPGDQKGDDGDGKCKSCDGTGKQPESDGGDGGDEDGDEGDMDSEEEELLKSLLEGDEDGDGDGGDDQGDDDGAGGDEEDDLLKGFFDDDDADADGEDDQESDDQSGSGGDQPGDSGDGDSDPGGDGEPAECEECGGSGEADSGEDGEDDDGEDDGEDDGDDEDDDEDDKEPPISELLDVANLAIDAVNEAISLYSSVNTDPFIDYDEVQVKIDECLAYVTACHQMAQPRSTLQRSILRKAVEAGYRAIDLQELLEANLDE
jgi:hypothetical protein